jgi:ATP-dependent exoDNAse (exonuclease V) alpha subunit
VAIFHLAVKPVSRGSGRSATAASAYRSATRIRDEATGEVFDYSRKRGVEHTEILLPAGEGAATWALDRERLWNTAEQAEHRKDARVAREYEVALPHELTAPQRMKLTRAFARDIADRYRCVVDVAIHAPHRKGDERNHHAHLLVTTRELAATGLAGKTTIELKDTDRSKLGLPPARVEVIEIRERWSALINEHLAQRGVQERVDHRSLEAQGIDRTPQSHLGPVVNDLRRQGKPSEVLDRILAEQQREAIRRLATAAERGQLERELQGLARSILDVETSLKSALAQRDARRQPVAEPAARSRPPPTPDNARQAAQDRWLKDRDLLIDAKAEVSAERGRILVPDRIR